jgi:hypothetical protein
MATAVLTGTFGVLAAAIALVLAIPLIRSSGRLVVVSGLFTGFGGLWLTLMAAQYVTGGRISDQFWVLFGIVPLAIGVVALVVLLAGRGRGSGPKSIDGRAATNH